MAEKGVDFFDASDFDWSAYLASRPPYPQSLYDIIFEHHQRHSNKWDHAYDMGTGVGIVAWQLASRFENITASDPSAYHVSVARTKRPNFRFLQCKAEDVSQLEANWIDLITIAEAIFYTDYSALIASAAHSLRKTGTLAAWFYDIVPHLVVEPGSEPDEAQLRIYEIFDAMISFVLSKLGTTSPGVKIWSDMINLHFNRKDWAHVRRLHWKRHREFGEFISTLVDEAPVTNSQRPWETVEEQEESCMIVRNADMGWLTSYMDSLYPGIKMSEICPEELAALEGTMQNGRKVDLAFTTSLVLATKRYDVSPLWANPEALSALIHDIEDHFKAVQYDLIVALDALGFILGGALAHSSGKGLVPLRKGGKLPLPEDRLVSVEFEDYDRTEKRFEIVKDLIKPGSRVLLVDEWMGTGAQMRVAIQVIEDRLEATIAGIAVLYVFPDEPANLEMLKHYETFAANCLKCKHMDCQCQS